MVVMNIQFFWENENASIVKQRRSGDGLHIPSIMRYEALPKRWKIFTSIHGVISGETFFNSDVFATFLVCQPQLDSTRLVIFYRRNYDAATAKFQTHRVLEDTQELWVQRTGSALVPT